MIWSKIDTQIPANLKDNEGLKSFLFKVHNLNPNSCLNYDGLTIIESNAQM